MCSAWDNVGDHSDCGWCSIPAGVKQVRHLVDLAADLDDILSDDDVIIVDAA